MSLFNQVSRTSKKLVPVWATSAPMTKANKKGEVILKKVPCIRYPLRFHKDKKNKIRTLINLGSEVNAIISGHVAKIGLKVCPTDIKARKIDASTL